MCFTAAYERLCVHFSRYNSHCISLRAERSCTARAFFLIKAFTVGQILVSKPHRKYSEDHQSCFFLQTPEPHRGAGTFRRVLKFGVNVAVVFSRLFLVRYAPTCASDTRPSAVRQLQARSKSSAASARGRPTCKVAARPGERDGRRRRLSKYNARRHSWRAVL